MGDAAVNVLKELRNALYGNIYIYIFVPSKNTVREINIRILVEWRLEGNHRDDPVEIRIDSNRCPCDLSQIDRTRFDSWFYVKVDSR